MADIPEEEGIGTLPFIPIAMGVGYGIHKGIRDVRSGRVKPRDWFRNPLQGSIPARNYVTNLGQSTLGHTGVSKGTLSSLQQMSQQELWTRGLNVGWARRAVAESTRSSLLQGFSMNIKDIDALTQRILQPGELPYTGTGNIFDTALQNVLKHGRASTFLESMQKYTSGNVPGVFTGFNEEMFNIGVKNLESSIPTAWGKTLEQAGLYTVKERVREFNSITGKGPGSLVATMKIRIPDIHQNISLTLPVSTDIYSKHGSQFILNQIMTGVPSRGDAKLMTWSDYYLQQFTGSTVPAIKEALTGVTNARERKRIIRSHIRNLNQEMSQYMTYVPANAHPGQAFINYMNAKTIAAPELSEAAARKGSAIDIDREMALLYKDPNILGRQIFPLSSGAKIMSGRVFAGFDPRALWAYSADFPTERKPLQFIREFVPSSRAMQAMKENAILNKFQRTMPFLATPTLRKAIGKGVVPTQFMTHYALPGGRLEQALRATGLAAEEMLVSQSLSPLLETERMREITIGATEAIGDQALSQWLEGAIEPGGMKTPFKLNPTQLIGYEPGTGKPIYASNIANMTEEIVSAQGWSAASKEAGKEQKIASKFLKLQIRETHQGDPKFFGSNKVVARVRDGGYLQQVFKNAGIHQQNVETVGYLDDIRKNRALLKQQMASALALEAQEYMTAPIQLTKRIAALTEVVRRKELAARVDLAMAPQHAQISRKFIRRRRASFTSVPVGKKATSTVYDIQTPRAWRRSAASRKGLISSVATNKPAIQLDVSLNRAKQKLAVLTQQLERIYQTTGTNPQSLQEIEAFLSLVGKGEEIEKLFPTELSMLQTAKRWGLDVRNIGGAIPFAQDILPASTLQELTTFAGGNLQSLVPRSGMIRGLAIQTVGGYRHTAGAGLMNQAIRGTIEPRTMLHLMENAWPVGKTNVAHMIAGDIAASMPSYGAGLDELQRIAQSITGKVPTNLPVVNVAPGSKFELTQTGYMLNLGTGVPEFGGASQIYVPPEGVLQRLGQYRTASGEIQSAEFAMAYRDLHRAAREAMLAKDRVRAEAALSEAAKGMKRAITREIATTMFGRGGGSGVTGALRGRMAGSAWLRQESVDLALGQESKLGLAYVSERAGLEMFEQLEQAGTDKTFVAAQREAFLRGEDVAGIVMRHPTVGPYHLQPTMIRKSNVPGSAIDYFGQVPERTMKAVQTSLGEMEVNFSQVVGMMSDFDDDHVVLKFIGEQKTADATRQLLSSFTSYNRYAAEHQVLAKLAKMHTPADPQEVLDVGLGGAKIRIGAAETARISVPLTEARLAIAAHRPEMSTQFNMLSAIMEEQIIKGKKMRSMSQNIAKQVATSIKNIHRAGDVEVQALGDVTRGMFGPELAAGVDISIPGGESWRFQMDANAVWKEVQGAMAEATQRGGIVERYRKLARQRGAKMALDEVVEELRMAQAGTSDMLANMAVRGMSGVTKTGRMAGTMRSVLTNVNEGIKRAGIAAKSWGKPALYGLAGTAAIMMLKGGPSAQPLTVSPDNPHGDVNRLSSVDQMTASRTMRGLSAPSRDLRPETLPMGDQVTGKPTAPGMSTPKTYMTNSPPAGYRVIARGSTSGAPSEATVAAALQPIARNASTRITFSDRRRKMTSQDVDDILERP